MLSATSSWPYMYIAYSYQNISRSVKVILDPSTKGVFEPFKGDNSKQKVRESNHLLHSIPNSNSMKGRVHNVLPLKSFQGR